VTADGSDAAVWYFAYGSNLQRATFCGRRGIECLRAVPVRVPGWRLVFDKPSIVPSGHATANIVAEPDAEVLGVAYEIARSDLEHVELTEGVPLGNYRRITVPVEPLLPQSVLPATAYSLGSERRDPSLLPSTRYVSIVVEGALEHRLPDAWIAWLRAVPAEPERPESIALREAIDRMLAKRPRA
jgi:hypothetical protein